MNLKKNLRSFLAAAALATMLAVPTLALAVASGLSTYAHQALLNGTFGKTSSFGTFPTAPTIYVALSSTTPTAGACANVTEPSSGSYARKSTVASDWNTATSANPSVVTNANAITFATATGDWVSAANLTHFLLYDALTTGNCLGWGPLTTAKPVLNGDTASFGAAALQVQLGTTP
jgi:hypothetical protein